MKFALIVEHVLWHLELLSSFEHEVPIVVCIQANFRLSLVTVLPQTKGHVNTEYTCFSNLRNLGLSD